jgi:hypothetical protein
MAAFIYPFGARLNETGLNLSGCLISILIGYEHHLPYARIKDTWSGKLIKDQQVFTYKSRKSSLSMIIPVPDVPGNNGSDDQDADHNRCGKKLR